MDSMKLSQTSAFVVAALSLALAAVIIYMPSPLFPFLSDNDSYRALGWERRGEGTWNGSVGWFRDRLRGFNRTLLDPAFIRPFFVGVAGIVSILTVSLGGPIRRHEPAAQRRTTPS